MKKKFGTVAVSIVLVFAISSCGKDDDSNNNNNNNNNDNWAAAVAGTYTGQGSYTYGPITGDATTIITRIGNKQINVQLQFDYKIICYDSVSMDNANTFILNEHDECLNPAEDWHLVGSGVFAGDSLNFSALYDFGHTYAFHGAK